MEHNENNLMRKYPIVNKIFGIISAILVVYFVLEWDDVTKSYWGFVYLVIALPGMFLPLLNLFKRKKKVENIN